MFFVILALVATVASADGTPVQLPDGEISNVLVPGVDGVSHPRLIRSSMEMPAWPETQDKLQFDGSYEPVARLAENEQLSLRVFYAQRYWADSPRTAKPCAKMSTQSPFLCCSLTSTL